MSLEHARLVKRLTRYLEAASARVTALKEQLDVAEGFASGLRREINRQKKKATAQKK